jgi:phage tail sheath protein FI
MYVDGDLTRKPTHIGSMTDYENLFGIAGPETGIKVSITTDVGGFRKVSATLAEADRSRHLMWYAVRMYFDNGGGRCYVCSVANYADLDVDALKDGLAAVGKEDEPTLIVFPEAQYLSISDCKALYDQALRQCASLQNRFLIMDVHGGDVSLNDSASSILQAVQNFRDSGTPSDNLMYGAAYAPNIETTMPFPYATERTAVTVDGTTSSLDAWQASDDNAYHLAIAAIGELRCKLPPSGAMAGIYVATDNARGVWSAPANACVANAIKPTIAIDDAAQGRLDMDSTGGKSVNAIRMFTGLGILVWGARTLAGNDNDWRYVNARRLCIFVHESISQAIGHYVLQPNDAATWASVESMIEAFLTSLWQMGGLIGAKAQDAFSVQVGLGSAMAAIDVRESRMTVTVRLCAVKPAEFIEMYFIQAMAAP